MSRDDKKDESGIEVRISPDANKATRDKVQILAELFNGPLFAKMVRDAVEEMILEGKLGYDLDSGDIDVPEDIVKRWAAKMERKVWSKRKRKR